VRDVRRGEGERRGGKERGRGEGERRGGEERGERNEKVNLVEHPSKYKLTCCDIFLSCQSFNQIHQFQVFSKILSLESANIK
jgi:hypothetical protein